MGSLFSLLFLVLFCCVKLSHSGADFSNEYLDDLSIAARKVQTPKLIENTSFVIASVVNLGFSNHFHNFDCFMRRLDLKYLVFALDVAVYRNLSKKSTSDRYQVVHFRLAGEDDTTNSASEFRSHDFNVITARKTAAVLSLLRLSIDVLFLDIDVVLLGDPRSYIFWQNVAYVHTLNLPCDSTEQHWGYFHNRRMEGNTGFYFVRSLPQTISLWEEVYVWMQRSYRIDDQTYFWRILRGLEHRTLPLGECRHLSQEYVGQNISLCMLNSCLFSSGMLSSPHHHRNYLSNLAALNVSPIAIHANFIKSKEKKVAALQQYKLWLPNESSSKNRSCLSFKLGDFTNS